LCAPNPGGGVFHEWVKKKPQRERGCSKTDDQKIESQTPKGEKGPGVTPKKKCGKGVYQFRRKGRHRKGGGGGGGGGGEGTRRGGVSKKQEKNP